MHRIFYDLYGLYWAKGTARWLSIITDGFIYSAFHGETGESYLRGVYNGWVYHPAEDEFDLTQVIAIFTWTTMLGIYQFGVNAQYDEHDEGPFNPKQRQIQKTRSIPILKIQYNF